MLTHDVALALYYQTSLRELSIISATIPDDFFNDDVTDACIQVSAILAEFHRKTG